jgi:hypothetical protein
VSVNSWIRRQFKNGVSVTDTVPSGFSSSATSFTAADGSTFPDGTVGPFTVVADQGLATEEKIQVLSRSGAVFTVNTGGRGYNGTTAYTHAAGCSILHTIDQQDLDEANQVAVQTLGAIQATGDLLVGSGTNALVRLARGTANQFLQAGASSLTWTSFGTSLVANVSSSNSDGVSNTPSRADHIHALPASVALSQLKGAFSADQQIVSGTGVGTGELIDLLLAFSEYFTANGQLVTGTGNGTGAVLAAPGTNGFVLTGQSGDAGGMAWQYPTLTQVSGSLASNYNVTTSLATFLTTGSLAAGTWLVSLEATPFLGDTSGSQNIQFEAVTGTATATFAGATSTEVSNDIASNYSAVLNFIATVTVAGTLVFQAIANNTVGTPQVCSTTPTNGYAKATGYTAVRIA